MMFHGLFALSNPRTRDRFLVIWSCIVSLNFGLFGCISESYAQQSTLGTKPQDSVRSSPTIESICQIIEPCKPFELSHDFVRMVLDTLNSLNLPTEPGPHVTLLAKMYFTNVGDVRSVHLQPVHNNTTDQLSTGDHLLLDEVRRYFTNHVVGSTVKLSAIQLRRWYKSNEYNPAGGTLYLIFDVSINGHILLPQDYPIFRFEYHH